MKGDEKKRETREQGKVENRWSEKRWNERTTRGEMSKEERKMREEKTMRKNDGFQEMKW